MARNSGSMLAAGSDLVGATAQSFTFSPDVGVCQIFSSLDAPDIIYGKWNAANASLTAWDFYLAPGDAIQSPPGVSVASVSLYSATGQTYGSNFRVLGYLSGIVGA